MKKFRYTFFILFIAISASAQTPLNTAVDFTVTDVDGNTHTLFDYLNAGKYVMIDFFFISDPASQQATPLINQSYIDFGCNSGNVIFLGIDNNDTNIGVNQFINTYGMDFPAVSGIDGGGNAVCSDYQITIYPTNILIGPDQSILSQNLYPYYLFTNLISLSGGIQQPCPETIVADFEFYPQTVVVGNSIIFTDLSTGNPVAWIWTFIGGSPSTSVAQNPGAILYSTIGVFPVTLLVSNGITSDQKTDYVHVVPPGAPYPDFIASDTDIVVNDTISFTDLTTGDPTSWFWTFVGGEPIHSSDQNPENIAYYYSGDYTVSLTASNSFGQSYKTKHFYIHVASSEPPVDYCDTLSNLLPYDSLMVLPVAPWGHIPGHNYYNITEYADQFNDSTYEVITALIVPVHIANSSLINSNVRFKIWDGDTIPGSVLGYKDIPISTMTPNFYRIVEFDEPVPIQGKFFAGYQITYNPGDNFAASITKNRGPAGTGTLFIKYDNQWQKFSDIELFGYYKTSMGILPVACNPNSVDETDLNTGNIIVYPNPAADRVNVFIDKNEIRENSITVFDITGRIIKADIDQMDNKHLVMKFSEISSGLYLIRLETINSVITKKILINK